MKGIEKNKHEHLMKCLEELRLQTTDAEQRHNIEAEITTLFEIYESYLSFINAVETQADRYNFLYKKGRTLQSFYEYYYLFLKKIINKKNEIVSLF